VGGGYGTWRANTFELAIHALNPPGSLTKPLLCPSADFPHMLRPFCVPHSPVGLLGNTEEVEDDLLELGQLG